MKSKEYLAKDIMLNQLAYYEREDNELIDSLYDVLGDEVEGLLHKINDLYKQLNVDTATWGLDIWESNLDINISDNLSYEERRAIIKTKLKAFGKISTGVLESAIQDYYKGKVHVYFNHRLLFELPMEGDSQKQLAQTIEVINLLKPAHLGYEIQLIMEPITSKIQMGTYSMMGEETIIYPNIITEPEINPYAYIGVGYGGLGEEVKIGREQSLEELNFELDISNVANLTNQLEQIVIHMEDKEGK